MFLKIKTLMLISILFYLSVSANPTLPTSGWLNGNILTLLDHSIEKELPNTSSLPVSINFFTADLKFDGQNIKFCEIGNGLYGVPLPSYSIINGQQELLYTPYWDLFWVYLKQFILPIWYIGTCHDAGINVLKKLGGKIFLSPKDFSSNLALLTHKNRSFVKTTAFSDYEGIIVYSSNRKIAHINRLKRKCPNVLWVNNLPAFFERRKDNIHEFFNNKGINSFRPQWKVYPKSYTSELAQKIMAELPAAHYVIKPLIGQRAKGVFMVPQEDLDTTLKHILQASQCIKNSNNPYLDSWCLDKNEKFVIEEYVPSKTIYINGKPYDPTLRATIFAYCDGKKVSVNLVSAFWKIPPSSLDDDKAPLTAKHITKSMIGCTTPGHPVDPEDMAVIRRLLNAGLPDIYIKLLEALSAP